MVIIIPDNIIHKNIFSKLEPNALLILFKFSNEAKSTEYYEQYF